MSTAKKLPWILSLHLPGLCKASKSEEIDQTWGLGGTGEEASMFPGSLLWGTERIILSLHGLGNIRGQVRCARGAGASHLHGLTVNYLWNALLANMQLPEVRRDVWAFWLPLWSSQRTHFCLKPRLSYYKWIVWGMVKCRGSHLPYNITYSTACQKSGRGRSCDKPLHPSTWLLVDILLEWMSPGTCRVGRFAIIQFPREVGKFSP